MNKKQSLYGLLFIAVAFASCVKKEVTPLGEEGKTFVKILGGGTPAEVKKNPIDFVGTPQRILVCDIRKDAANTAALNGTTTVVVKDDTAAVTAADPAYLHFPANWYTLEAEVAKLGGVPASDPDPAKRGRGGTWTFTFSAGDFAKQIYINIPNAQLMNPSSLYALGFTIITVSSDGTISTQKSVVIEIGAKNNWDGIYAVRGPVTDIVTPNLIQWANQQGYTDPFLVANPNSWELHLVTGGATQCVGFDNTIWGSPAHPLHNTNPIQNTGYGSFGLVVNFNPATNTVASIYNYYGDPTRPATNLGNPAGGSGPPLYAAGNTRRAELDPSGANVVQGNKNIVIKYFMWHPSATAPPLTVPRTTFDETWEYVGPR